MYTILRDRIGRPRVTIAWEQEKKDEPVHYGVVLLSQSDFKLANKKRGVGVAQSRAYHAKTGTKESWGVYRGGEFLNLITPGYQMKVKHLFDKTGTMDADEFFLKIKELRKEWFASGYHIMD